MDYTPLIEWDLSDKNRITGTLEIFYIVIRKTNYKNPYELRFIQNGDILFLMSFESIEKAMTFAQKAVTRYYVNNNVISIESDKEDNKIIDLNEWRERHGSKK